MSDKKSEEAELAGQDMKHQILEWKIERIGWIVWALIILAGLAGLLGEGPFSEQVAGDRSSPLWVEYQRFERYQSPTKLVIHAKTEEPRIRLWINYGLMKEIEISHIDPEPGHVEAGPDRYVLPLDVRGMSRDIVITIYFKYNKSGMIHTELGTENGPALRFSQLVYP